MQFAATIAADRQQRELARVRAGVERPGTHQHDVDQARAIAHQRLDRFVGREACLQRRVRFLERAPERGDRLSRNLERDRRQALVQRRKHQPGRGRRPAGVASSLS